MPSMLPRLFSPSRTLGGRVAATRSGRRSFRLAPAAWSPKERKADNSIPFVWGVEGIPGRQGIEPGTQSTITPSEASIFRGIFDEIAQGRKPAPKKWASRTRASPARAPDALSSPDNGATGMAQSIVEQARMPELREKFLLRYPPSLREAAVVALGLYELEPGPVAGDSEARELDDKEAEKRKERARYDGARKEERSRIITLIKACETDVALWHLMEAEIFSLPKELGILRSSKAKSPAKRGGKRSAKDRILESTEPLGEDVPADDKTRSMDIHGPLYPYFLNLALTYFDRSFTRSSPFAYQILPRIKELGLLSYVLGVSTPFYARLARMYWYRFGDAHGALGVLREMNAAGLQPDDSVSDLLTQIRLDLHACAGGDQGPFVSAIVKSPPYDGTLTQKLMLVESEVRQSFEERAIERLV
ncbi:hypothetical protein HRG_008325 [Hirsutella rhossiliensis]|uniref:Mtf2-like C-terminal domain-containing protein n=1 Tax=Hirsutella rhossiliensis TaxID=111463 RepID=A0A9P8SG79_9HYPO|nr:uncharacterized protein HRG_08325 [Hirsutella rhossiliensis]KAH0960170.1 hypothetical protein HRG_08325 [Hirsutella rhossiliensis]